MEFVIGFLVVALGAWAQSPHVHHSNKTPRLEVQVHRLSIREVTKLSSNASTEPYPSYEFLSERQGTEPTPREQEGRRPPMFPMPNCFWCPTQRQLNGKGWDLLNLFTTDEFLRRTRAQPDDLTDTCVFYSKPVRQPPDALSQMATQLACKYEKYSIWHLWPNRRNEQYNDRLLNFYGIFKSDNRLYPISQLGNIPNTAKPAFIQYFENMSRAMAIMCTGQIYLMTQTPENLQQYATQPLAPNIWSTTEYSALMAHRQTLSAKLIVINATFSNGGAKPLAWSVDWGTLNMQDPANYRRDGSSFMEGWEPYDLDSELEPTIGPQRKKRTDLCIDSGVEDEPPGMDFFG